LRTIGQTQGVIEAEFRASCHNRDPNGDRFAAAAMFSESVDRYNTRFQSDFGAVNNDAASSVVLHRRPPFPIIVAVFGLAQWPVAE
jgi:hypothetical protein